MPENSCLPPHCIVQFRDCPVCRKTLYAIDREFGSFDEVRRWVESDRHESAIPLCSLPCPDCDGPGLSPQATHIALYADGKMIGPPAEIGSWVLPVGGHEASGPVVTEPEKVAAEDAAQHVFSRWPPELFAELGETYADLAVSSGKCRSVWNRWDVGTWREVFAGSGLTLPFPGDEKARPRLAEQHACEVMRAWVMLLVRRIQFVGLRLWADKAPETYDPWTVEFVLSSIPLPDGLEHVRTEALARLVRRPEHSEAALWRRLKSLQGELDRARSRTTDLSRRLDEERRLRAEREKKIGSLSSEVRRLRDGAAAGHTVRPGISRREEWRGLIDELRARVRELEHRLGDEERVPDLSGEPVPRPESAPEEDALLLERLKGKTVAVAGGPWPRFPEGDWPCRVVHWDGWREEGLERAVSESDVVVVVSSHISHQAYWGTRAEALYQDRPLALAAHTNPRLVLLAAAEAVD